MGYIYMIIIFLLGAFISTIVSDDWKYCWGCVVGMVGITIPLIADKIF